MEHSTSDPAAAPVDSLKARVKAELDELRTQAKGYSLDDLRSGIWLEQLLRHALQQYRERVNAEYFERKYPGLDRDARVDRRIALAQQYAALSGGLSASAYSAAVVATLGSHGGASPITVPAAVTSLATDVFFVSRIQLRTAYDISVLYGRPVDLDDPEDLILLIQLAFGVKAGEHLQNAAAKLAPEVVRQGVKRVVTGSTRVWIQSLPVVGKYLLQRNIIKMAIPGVAIPLSSGVNYFTTGRIAAMARQLFRDRAFLEEAAPTLLDDLDDSGILLLLQVMILVIHADGKTAPEEASLLDAVVGAALEEDGDPVGIQRVLESVKRDEDRVLAELAAAPPDLRAQIYEAACLTSAMDRKLKRKEEKQLRRVAGACGVDYDRQHVEWVMEQMSG